MSITTLDQLLGGMVGGVPFLKFQGVTPVSGTWYSLWNYNGIPGAGGIPSGGGTIKGHFYTSVSTETGQLFFSAPVDGDTNYLARFAVNANTVGTLILADRIWGDTLSITSTSTTIYSGAFPRSYGIGAGDSSGDGIFLGVEVYTTLGAGTPTPKATIINSEGVGDTVTCWSTVPATAVAGTFVPMYATKQAYGVRSVRAFHNFATHTSGVWGLTAYRPIARISSVAAGIEDSVDALTSGFPKFFENTVPMLFWVAGSTTAVTMIGNLFYAKG